MNKSYRFRSKIFLLITSAFLLAACQHAPASMTAPKTVDLVFELPSNNNQHPIIAAGPEDAYVNKGDFINLSVKPGSGSVMLIINDAISPFKDGGFVYRVTPGKSFNEEIAEGRIGTYKYTLIEPPKGNDISTRPPFDPKIIVQQ